MSVKRAKFWLWPLAIGAAFSSAPAQEQQPTIRTQVPLVLAPANVTDHSGKPIDGLKVSDFALTDEGTPQEISLDTSDTVLAPVALVLAVQASGISQPALARIRQIGGMIHPVITGERGQTALLAYDSEVRVLESFTTNADAIRTSIAGIDARTYRSATLTDAVIQGVRMLATRPSNYRRILLIVGESRDRGSKAKLKTAIDQAQRAGAIVYPITYSAQKSAWTSKPSDDPPLPGDMDLGQAFVELGRLTQPNEADSLAFASGGRHLSFTTLKGLEDALNVTGREIHSQYLLSFVPMASGPPHYHRLSVKVVSRSDAVVRARPGYWPAE